MSPGPPWKKPKCSEAGRPKGSSEKVKSGVESDSDGGMSEFEFEFEFESLPVEAGELEVASERIDNENAEWTRTRRKELRRGDDRWENKRR